MKDHAILRQGVEILEGMVRTLEQGDRIDIADAVAVLKIFQILEPSDEQGLVGAAETALRSRKGQAFVQTSRQLTVNLRNHLSMENVDQERATVSDTFTEKFANLARLEYKYASRTSATRSRRASALYGA